MKRSKYRNIRTEVDGIKFDSKKEAEYYGELKLRQMAGEIRYFLLQVPFQLPGNVKYRCDFAVCNKDGQMSYVDVKGVKTQVYKIKKKQVEALYGIEIEEV